MSHYKNGIWSEIWDGLYRRFLAKNKDKFANNPRMALMLSILARIDNDKLNKHQKIAAEYLKNLS